MEKHKTTFVLFFGNRGFLGCGAVFKEKPDQEARFLLGFTRGMLRKYGM